MLYKQVNTVAHTQCTYLLESALPHPLKRCKISSFIGLILVSTKKRYGLNWAIAQSTQQLTCLLSSILPGFLSSWEASLVFEWSTRFVLKWRQKSSVTCTPEMLWNEAPQGTYSISFPTILPSRQRLIFTCLILK